MTEEVVTKFDARQIRKWMGELKNVMPVIPSENGLVLTKDDRPIFRYILNSANGGLTPHEAYALTALLVNLAPMVEAVISQQRDFVMTRRALIRALNNPSPKQRGEIDNVIQDTAYIEGSS